MTIFIILQTGPLILHLYFNSYILNFLSLYIFVYFKTSLYVYVQ